MYYNSFALAVAALSSSVAAQTFSKCNPTRGDKCPPDPAFGKCNTPQTFDFTTVASGQGWTSDSTFNSWWTSDGGVQSNPSLLNIDSSKGAALIISAQGQAPLVKSNNYLFFGRVDVEIQVAPGQGVITCIVLESDDLDEIDWEWLGGRPNEVQSNFFSKGVSDYTHGGTHGLAFAATEGIHTYSLDWKADKIEMYADGVLLRTVTPAEVDNGSKWPQTPAQLKLGTWVAGQSSLPQGTVNWAGGLADFSKVPFIAYYKKVTVTDYCNGKSSAKEYSYGDSSGSASSIQVIGGDSSSSSSPSVPASGSDTSSKPSPGPGSDSSAAATPKAGKGNTNSTSTGQSSTKGNSTSTSTSASSPVMTAGAVTMSFSSVAAGLAALGYLLL